MLMESDASSNAGISDPSDEKTTQKKIEPLKQEQQHQPESLDKWKTYLTRESEIAWREDRTMYIGLDAIEPQEELKEKLLQYLLIYTVAAVEG
jgi:hypothetical protein